MKAGRELDTRVAEKVMGWKRIDRKAAGWGDGPLVWGTEDDSEDGSPTRQYFEPSTDIAAAWEVAEKLKADHIEPLIEWDEEDQEWYVHLTRYSTETECSEPICNAHAPDAPHAICLAALKALEDTP